MHISVLSMASVRTLPELASDADVHSEHVCNGGLIPLGSPSVLTFVQTSPAPAMGIAPSSVTLIGKSRDASIKSAQSSATLVISGRTYGPGFWKNVAAGTLAAVESSSQAM